MKYPLDNIRVLDFTIAMAGPLATQRLGDMGAEVIKVESFNGDLTRVFALCDVKLENDTTSYLSLNRNKKSVVINLKDKAGLDIIYELVKEVDVVIQNFRPGVAERLGIGYEELNRVNPKIVYASISGYGEDGDMREAPGQDLLVQGFSGMTFSGGIDEGPPHPAPTYFVDACASHLATSGILAALFQRTQTGVGQHVKTCLLAAAMETQSQEIMTYLKSKELAERSSAPYASSWLEPPYGIYRTQDGWIALPQNDMTTMSEVVESSELRELVASKPPINDKLSSAKWRTNVYELLSNSLLNRSTQEWVEVMTVRKIWCGQVQTIKELVEHSQTKYFIGKFKHPVHGDIECVAPAIEFSSMETTPLGYPPGLGEHTHEVLSSLNYSADEILQLVKNKVIM